MTRSSAQNESAASFAWLAGRLGLEDNGRPGRAAQAWSDTCAHMRRFDQGIVYSQDWISDPWLARTSKILIGFMYPLWDPPERLDEWPALGVRALADGRPWRATRTNYNALQGTLAQATPPAQADNRAAVAGFLRMDAEIQRHGDTRMVQIEHVRAWLCTAVGRLLMPIALTPPDQPGALAQATLDRLAMPRQQPIPPSWVNDFEDRRLDLLYNLRMGPDGQLVRSDIRVGQGEEWREHWGWLSSELGRDEMLEAMRLAAELLRCPALLEGMAAALELGDRYLATVALAVIRRWLLTLKAMTWLEHALAQSWAYVRPQDLACFAFNAMKPEWPRRVLAISHRSMDVKPALIEMKLWKASRCAIDANYVPSWETNTGMIWGLFAPTPAIARIHSPHYLESRWCNREVEMIQHLIDRGDFLSERWVLDVDLAGLRDLDQIATYWEESQDAGAAQGSGFFKGFPPFCHVWTPKAVPEWEVKMLRAAAALRMINIFVSDPELTNALAKALATGFVLPGPAPTNNPDRWAGYASILGEIQAAYGDDAGELAIRLPSDYSAEQQALDLEMSQRIPDLSSGTPALGDILVAFEWLRIEWAAMLEEGRGDFLLIDCSYLSREQWQSDVRLSLLRGLATMRPAGPVWFRQLANQDVEFWPLVGERPIFTEHVDTQFSWMLEIFLDRAETQALYPDACGLELSDALKQRCKAGSATS